MKLPVASVSLLPYGLAILLLGAPAQAAPSVPAKARDPEAVPEGLAKSDWSSIRAAYEAGRHAFQAVEGGWQARNPGQQWTAKFDGRGFLAEPEGGGWSWGLELKSYGFPGQELRHDRPAMVSASGQRLTWAWDGCLEEWLVNDQRGLEHGFTVRKRPASVPDSSPLRFHLVTRGSLRPRVSADARGLLFQDASGATVLNYSGLKVWDADGKILPARFEAEGEKSIRLLVEEHEARYPLTIDPIAQQAYLKASNTGAGDLFGYSVTTSGDTVVVAARDEDSNATGVNAPSTGGSGTQSDNSAENSGAVYVFTRSGATWSQQAYLKADNIKEGGWFGYSVAISGDTLAIKGSSGVYVFIRNGTNWSQQAYLKSSNGFGWSLAISGDTLVAGAPLESSNATGVNAPLTGGSGTQSDRSASESGAAYVFTRNGGSWSQQAYLKASNTDARDWFGYSVAISGDTVVVGAFQEDSKAKGVNAPLSGGIGTQGDNSSEDSGAAYVFVRNGGTWHQQAYLKASNTFRDAQFGYSVSISGGTVVVGSPLEYSNATGVNAPLRLGSGTQEDTSAPGNGAAYVFTRDGSTWSQQAYLKRSVYDGEGGGFFGGRVAISGDTLVVGAEWEDSNATGINAPLRGGSRTQTDHSAHFSGAAYVFTRGGGTWRQQAYLKASNTDRFDFFGHSVAVSGDTVVVGAWYESSNATGVNAPPTGGSGTQADNSAKDAGAVYVFTGLGSPSAVVTPPVTPPVTQTVPPIEGWRQQHFGKIANTAEAAKLSDPDHDGAVNLLEYGLATIPTAGPGQLPAPLIAARDGGSYLATSFTRDPSRNDITIRVEATSDLSGPWTAVASSITGADTTGAGFVSEIDLVGGLKQVEVRDIVPSSAAARRFLRIVVE